MLIRWNKTNNLNINLLGNQRKKLIALINDLILAQNNGTIQLIIVEVLKKIIEYSDHHFSMEEDMMRKCKYPNLDEHIKEHDEFKMDISKLKLESQKSNLLISVKTLWYLKDWTISHILGTDKEFGDYLTAKELGNYPLHEIAVN